MWFLERVWEEDEAEGGSTGCSASVTSNKLVKKSTRDSVIGQI